MNTHIRLSAFITRSLLVLRVILISCNFTSQTSVSFLKSEMLLELLYTCECLCLSPQINAVIKNKALKRRPARNKKENMQLAHRRATSEMGADKVGKTVSL